MSATVRTSAERDRGRGTEIDLCGTLRVRIAGRDVTAQLPARQGRVLFAFLVVHRGRAVARDELIDVLWPVDPPDAPEAGLSTVLARLRSALGGGVLTGRTELELRLDPDADIDVERAAARALQAQSALTARDSEAATAAARETLAIVRRPLLPELDADWVQAARGRLEELELGMLELLVQAALAGDGEQLAGAESIAREIVAGHAFRESGYALLMKVQARLGNVAMAILSFDEARVKLREIGAVPSAELSALHEQLLRTGRLVDDARDAPPPAARAGAAAARVVPLPAIGGVVTSTPFVGRHAQLETLRRRWREAATGRRRFELLMGEPGVGKTRLAARLASELHAGGATVLYGRCDEEPLLAYQPFVEALRHYLHHGDWRDGESDPDPDLQQLARLVPEAGVADGATAESFAKDPNSERYILFQAVARLIDRATHTRPLLLVLDDLHWADKPTLLLLRHVLRRSEPSRLMVLGIFRDVEVDDDHPLVKLTADLRREQRFERLALDGLDERETEALVAARLQVPASEAFVRGLRTRTEGNPFFMEEALRSLVEAQTFDADAIAGEQALASIGVPDSVADVILRRLGGLQRPTRDILNVAAVIGREFAVSLVEALVDLPADRVIDAIEEAISRGLVGEVAGVSDRFMFCHALVRDAIYDRIFTSRLLRMHLRVGEALLEGRGAAAARSGELAYHFYLARELGVAAEAVRHCVRAGEEAAQSLAYEESAQHYRRALEAFALDPEGDESRRCDILLAQGRVQWQAGEVAARETYFEAAASARRRGAAQQLAAAALGLGERYWEARSLDTQFDELLAEALDVLPDEDSRPRARLMARMAENLHFTAEHERGAQLSIDALEMARRLGEVDTLKTALMGRHVALLHVEHLDERVALIDEVLALAKGHRPLTAEAHHWRLFDLCELGDLSEAHRDHGELSRLARELRQPVLGHVALGWQGMFAHLAGDVEKAERLSEQCFEVANRAKVVSARSSQTSMLFTLRRHQGRLAELLPAMDALQSERSASPASWKAALALAQVETGAVQDGRERYERLAGSDFSPIPRDWFWSFTMGLMAETCALLRDDERAPLLYDLLTPFADRFVQVIFTVNWGSVQRYLGLLAGAMDRFDVAAGHFDAALEGNAHLGAVLMTAETQCAYGALLVRRGRDGDRQRAAQLGALAEQIAAPRALHDLKARARALRNASAPAR